MKVRAVKEEGLAVMMELFWATAIRIAPPPFGCPHDVIIVY
jgi:hypothetical protein